MNLSSKLNETLTYWAPSTPDGYGGRSYSSPVTFSGRWEDVQELFINVLGEEVVSVAKVYAERDFELNGFLFNGESEETNPANEDGAREIRKVGKTPSLQADVYLREVWL